eukprot:GGOE01019545.1.p1 GENE.GGOE01019545.1~~GGOE01019545.1.p1  ORF type:complete len:540 (-),score=57.79 GGOE01019545.1:314-1933(-)
MQASAIHVPSLFKPSPACVPVIDPELKHLGRVWLPTKHLEHTAGVERWVRRDAHPPSLCILFQDGRCNAGRQCNQIHADPAHIEAVRSAVRLLPRNNCCYAHGDVPSQREDFRRFLEEHGLELICPGAEPLPIPVEWVAMTMFWDRFLRTKRNQKGRPSGAFRFSAQRVCKLHQRSACKYGVDCNSVHLCREIWARICNTMRESPALLPAGDPMAPLSNPPPPRIVEELSMTHHPYEVHSPPPAPAPVSLAPHDSVPHHMAMQEGAATSSAFVYCAPLPDPPKRPLLPSSTREQKILLPSPCPLQRKPWPPQECPSPVPAGCVADVAPAPPASMRAIASVRQPLLSVLPDSSPKQVVTDATRYTAPALQPVLLPSAVAPLPAAGLQYATMPSLPIQPTTVTPNSLSPHQALPCPTPRAVTLKRHSPYSPSPSPSPSASASPFAPSIGDAGYRAPPGGHFGGGVQPSSVSCGPAEVPPSGVSGGMGTVASPMAFEGPHDTLTTLMNRLGPSLSHPPPRRLRPSEPACSSTTARRGGERGP